MIATRCFAKFVNVILPLALVSILFAACGGLKSTATLAVTKAASPLPSPFHAVLKTSDGLRQLQFSITPNRLGENMFLIDVEDARSGKPVTNEQAQLFATMLDMDMGTGVVLLQPAGHGRYSAQGMLSMDGNWDMHVQLLDASGTAVHVATLKIYVPA